MKTSKTMKAIFGSIKTNLKCDLISKLVFNFVGVIPQIQHIKNTKTHQFTHCCISQDNSLLLTSSSEGEVKLWDVVNGKLIQNFKIYNSTTLISCKFSKNENHVICNTMDNKIMKFEIKSGKLISNFLHQGIAHSTDPSPSHNATSSSVDPGFRLFLTSMELYQNIILHHIYLYLYLNRFHLLQEG